MNTQDRFADIRPYEDAEVPTAISRLLNDDEFIAALTHYRFGKWSQPLACMLQPLVRQFLRWHLRKIATVDEVQQRVSAYMERMIRRTTTAVTYSGLEQLSPNQSYLFISNHRDIAMDPAFVNWGLYQRGFTTARVAIGDNLLRKPAATELMRLNKSFIVKRSAKAPREMLKALSELSTYISTSLQDGHNIWIAQREGRAKDGDDRTEPALLKMLYMAGKHQHLDFATAMAQLNIVPVSISYEFDPTDSAKSAELYQRSVNGTYQKGEFEDIESIITGIVGTKGRVHIAFGTPLKEGFATPEELAAEIDNQIWKNYRLFPNNYLAAGKLEQASTAEQDAFNAREAQIPIEQRLIWRSIYATPVTNANRVIPSDQGS